MKNSNYLPMSEMEKNKLDRLLKLLARIDSGESPVEIRAQEMNFLSTVRPKDICLAEQSLLSSGVTIEKLRDVCGLHIRVLENQLPKIRQTLPAGHVLRMIFCEHDMLECFLDDLLEVTAAIKNADYINSTSSEFRKLAHIIHHLMAAGQHNEREENIIFPELERRGFYGLPAIIRSEHSEVNKTVEYLKQLVNSCDNMGFNEFIRRLMPATHKVNNAVREHLFKENHILYPTALEVIDDPAVWKRIKFVCDEIGYCCFSHDAELAS